MEIAASGGNGGLSAKDMIQKSLKHAAKVKATENEPKSPDSQEGSETQKSLLSPPKKSKPVIDVELPVKEMIAESLHREHAEQAKKAKLKTRRQTEGPGLLKVSARGLRPMPAPWETEDMGKKGDSSDSCQQSAAVDKKGNAPQGNKTKEDIDAICRKKDLEIEELKAKLDAAMQETKVSLLQEHILLLIICSPRDIQRIRHGYLVLGIKCRTTKKQIMLLIVKLPSWKRSLIWFRNCSLMQSHLQCTHIFCTVCM